MSEGAEQDEAGPGKILGRASVAAVGVAYQQGITFLAGLLIARVIGAADFGIVNLGRKLLAITTVLTRMGLDVGLQRHFGEARAGSDPHIPRVVLRRVRLMASGVALLPILAVALGGGRMLEENVYNYAGFANVILVLALALPFTTDISVLGGAYRGTLKLAPSVLAENVLLPTIRLLTIIGLFLLGWRLWAVVTGTTVAAFIASAILAFRARHDFASDANPANYPWSQATDVIAYSSVLAVSLFIGTLTSSLDLLVLGRFVEAQSLGQYALVKTLLLLMGAFGIAFGQGLGALVAERFRRADVSGMVQVMSLTARWITLGTLPVYAIFLLWGSRLTVLFGESFAIAQPVVAWLATGQFLFSVLAPSGWALSMTGRQTLELKVMTAGLLTAGVLCWFAIPAYGQLGAAVATCSSIAVANFLRLYFASRRIGRLPFGIDLVGITAVGLGAALLCEVAAAATDLPALWGTITRIALFLCAYVAVSWFFLLREFEKRGIRAVVGRLCTRTVALASSSTHR